MSDSVHQVRSFAAGVVGKAKGKRRMVVASTIPLGGRGPDPIRIRGPVG